MKVWGTLFLSFTSYEDLCCGHSEEMKVALQRENDEIKGFLDALSFLVQEKLFIHWICQKSNSMMRITISMHFQSAFVEYFDLLFLFVTKLWMG